MNVIYIKMNPLGTVFLGSAGWLSSSSASTGWASAGMLRSIPGLAALPGASASQQAGESHALLQWLCLPLQALAAHKEGLLQPPRWLTHPASPTSAWFFLVMNYWVLLPPICHAQQGPLTAAGSFVAMQETRLGS